MAEKQTAYQFLKDLKKQDAQIKPGFSKLWDYLDQKAREKGVPLNGQLELTPLCNFDCKMCYTHLTRNQLGDRKLLTTDQWKQLIREAWDAGMLTVNLTGGECLTYPGFEEIYLYLHDLGCEIHVLSNGALLNDRWIRFFQEHKPSLLQMTLYGCDNDSYERVTGRRDFTIVRENIRSAIDAELPVSLVITPSKYLGEDVFETIRDAKETGAPYTINAWLSEPKEETGRAHQNHDMDMEYYTRIYTFRNKLEGFETHPVDPEKLPPAGGPYHQCNTRGLTCGAGRSCFTIEWDGRMLACNDLRAHEGWPLEEGFLPVWKRLNEISNNWVRTPECIECPYESVCVNCVARKEMFAEPGKQPIPLCERTRYYVRHGVRRIQACE